MLAYLCLTLSPPAILWALQIRSRTLIHKHTQSHHPEVTDCPMHSIEPTRKCWVLYTLSEKQSQSDGRSFLKQWISSIPQPDLVYDVEIDSELDEVMRLMWLPSALPWHWRAAGFFDMQSYVWVSMIRFIHPFVHSFRRPVHNLLDRL